MMHSKPFRFAAATVLLLGLSACGSSSPVSPDQSSVQFSTTDLVVGTGATAVKGNVATVFQNAWLYSDTATDHKGTQFDTSDQFPYAVGSSQIPSGEDQGIQGMQVGGTRRIIVPPSLAYGSTGAVNGTTGQQVVPPNAALVYEVTLISLQ